MKSQPPVAHRRLPYRGFTLMELLIVMVIIGILAALTIGAFRFAQEKAAKDRTVSAHATIRVALEQYKEKAGEYPEPASPNEEDKFTGHTMKIGGAHMLYQAISGDGTSAIHFQAVPPGGGGESNGQVDDLERDNVVSSTPLPKSMISPSNATVGQQIPRFLVDGWGRPFQYDKAATPAALDAPPVTPTTINPTYDLWSFGPMNSGTVPDDSLATKQDPQTTGPWIKNW